MTKEEQRIAIAEACGWKKVFMPGLRGLIVGKAPESWSKSHAPTNYEISSSGLWHEVPDYLNDLNAMFEAEKMLPTMGLILDYQWDLERQCSDNGSAIFSCATAAQRAGAFLRTLNLWKD